MEYKYKVNNVEYTVQIASIFGNKAQVFVNGTAYEVEMEGGAVAAPVAFTPAPAPVAAPAPAPAPAPVAEKPKEEAPATPAPEPSKPQATANVPAGGTPVKAPLPGIINDIKVAVGDQVKNGQVLLILEAMKMENEITAEQDGVISAISVSTGDSVMEGTVLLTIA
ncbi:MAG TPA: acetyl-CoA carboxylase biotin carboxyl carrier protein subunit [Prevotellaceae bacterium]|jgi:biotin carboxyl carrier protein|nr:acetyl-CoA carboxylase biotin carboxyl carrier protein subunit [Prevotellaceae bacterium]